MTQESIYILGIDPALRFTGVSLLKIDNPDNITLVKAYTINTSYCISLERSLTHLGRELEQILKCHTQIKICGVEELIFEHKRESTTFMLSMAYAIVKYILCSNRIPTKYMALREVRSKVCNMGQATKLDIRKYVLKMVKNIYWQDNCHVIDATAAAVAVYKKIRK